MKRMMASAALCLLLAGASHASAQAPKAEPPAPHSNQSVEANDAIGEQIAALGWTRAPATVPIGTVARVTLPAGTMYLGPADANRFVTMLGNPPMQNSYVIANRDLTWFAVFNYDASGYVRDDEQIDPAALLTSLRAMEVEDNQQRTQLGLEPMYLDGWAVQPHYDRASHNLEWGTRLRSPESGPVVNYTTRLLGRGGVVVTILVTTPETLAQDLADFRRVIAGFSFAPGQTYAEFREGDRVAEYGLAALVTGGAAAAAAKGGLFKALGGFLKLIIIGVIAAFGAVVAFFRRLTGRREEEEAAEWQ